MIRWIPFVLVVLATVLAQTTVAGLIGLHGFGFGGVRPDLLAILAVFVALNGRAGSEALLAGWLLGFALDLTTHGGPAGGLVLGPLTVSYALASWGLYRLREAFFREHAVAQALLGAVFCGAVHEAHVLTQCLLTGAWAGYGRMALQAAGVALYTGVLTPPVHWGLRRIAKWFMTGPAGAGRRGARSS